MKKIITILLSGFMIVGFSNVYAAATSNTSTTTKKASSQAVTVATVNIYNPKTTKTNGSQYSIFFDIYNRVGIQSDIRYGIELINIDTSTIVDTNLSNESLTLKEKETKGMVINYTIPGFIPSGNYKLAIVAQNKNGLPLAYMPASFAENAIIKVNNDSQDLAINNCVLTIFNDASSTAMYKNDQGVDIMPNEKLLSTCDVVNKKANNQNNVKIQLLTHSKDKFGDILANEVLTEVISIKRNSTQSVSFSVPTLQGAQLYYVDTFLVNSNAKQISPSYPIRYSVHGPSATILNLTMDKPSYKKGETANLKLFWVVGGGGIRISSDKDTYIIKAEIRNSLKSICGEAAKTTNNSSLAMNNTSFSIAMTKDCLPAISSVSIFDNKGNLLDTTEINVQNPVKNVYINAHIPSILNIGMLFNNRFRNYAVVFIVVLALIGYGIIKLRKKEEENKTNN